MDKPETLAILGIQDTGRRKQKQRNTNQTNMEIQKNKEGKTERTVKITVYLKDEQHRYHQNTEDDPRSSRRVSSSCFLRDNVKKH